VGIFQQECSLLPENNDFCYNSKHLFDLLWRQHSFGRNMVDVSDLVRFTPGEKTLRLVMDIAAALERYRIVMEWPAGVRLRKLNHIRTIRGTTAIEGNTLHSAQESGDARVFVDFMLDMILRTLKARGESQGGKKKVVRKGGRGRVGAESGQGRGRVGVESGDIKNRIVAALQEGELSKAGIAAAIGLDRVSGYLNRAVRALLAGGILELTLKDKPASRLQKYRLANKGMK
jgi:hypothetical protein